MKWRDQDPEQVSRLDAVARFRYFVERVAEEEAAWALWSKGWVSLPGEGGKNLLLLWPAREFAEQHLKKSGQLFQPRKIELEDLLQTVLPAVFAEGASVGVFPSADGHAIPMKSEELVVALEKELEKY